MFDGKTSKELRKIIARECNLFKNLLTQFESHKVTITKRWIEQVSNNYSVRVLYYNRKNIVSNLGGEYCIFLNEEEIKSMRFYSFFETLNVFLIIVRNVNSTQENIESLVKETVYLSYQLLLKVRKGDF